MTPLASDKRGTEPLAGRERAKGVRSSKPVNGFSFRLRASFCWERGRLVRIEREARITIDRDGETAARLRSYQKSVLVSIINLAVYDTVQFD